ncbi:MAG: hypothetical protein HY722_06425 [Planctomycetes bacterium]|nr:hypothetical protein [Planctomycetota bacterium]
MEEPPLVLPLSGLRPEHRPLVGGKAGSLGTLAASGFPVPEGFVLTTAATRTAAAGVLAGAARDALLSAYRSAFRPEDPLAVRSSGSLEDLEGASFAGLYETVLGVRGEEALVGAVARCLDSALAPRVRDYLERRGMADRGLDMAVVVQRLVAAEVSGVLFTVDPRTGREDEALVEAVFGLGEALVSGRVQPDRYVLDLARPGAKERRVARKALRVDLDVRGATREVPLGEAEGLGSTLDEARLVELAELALAVQACYGLPMDVEWVLAEGQISLVQARPITALGFDPAVGEWTTADLRDGGVSSDVCTPFMWSLYEHALQHSMPAYFRSLGLLARGGRTRWGRMFYARPYWNLGAVKEVLAAIPGFRERDFDRDLGVRPAYEGEGRTTPVTPLGVLRALPVLVRLRRAYRRRLALDAEFLRSFPSRSAPFEVEPLSSLGRVELVRRYRDLVGRFHFETESAYFDTIYNTSNSKLDFKPLFERARRAAGGEVSYLALVGGLERLSHMRLMEDLHRTATALAREGKAPDARTVGELAWRWRHHGERELDIRAPRWGEDPGPCRRALEAALLDLDPARDPARLSGAQHREYLRERTRTCRALRLRPLARRAFERGLDLVRAYAWWREEMRDRSSYVYWLVRRWTLEVARRLVEEGALEEAGQVWFLPYPEVVALLEGRLRPDEARRRIGVARRHMASFRGFRNPDEVGRGHSAGGPGAGPALTPAGALLGVGCAPGRARGVARVLLRLDDAPRLARGEVLVTAFTDPGWTPVLGRAGAVVTETGGLLSHAAVIAREYGIPAVLAVEGATSAIPDGATLEVDGAAGTVRVVAGE